MIIINISKSVSQFLLFLDLAAYREKVLLVDLNSGLWMATGIIRVFRALDSSNMNSRNRLRRHMKAKSMNTTDHPNNGRTRLATRSPMKEARAVPMKSKEYTFDPSL
jgi:hypothetical protein